MSLRGVDPKFIRNNRYALKGNKSAAACQAAREARKAGTA